MLLELQIEGRFSFDNILITVKALSIQNKIRPQMGQYSGNCKPDGHTLHGHHIKLLVESGGFPTKIGKYQMCPPVLVLLAHM